MGEKVKRIEQEFVLRSLAQRRAAIEVRNRSQRVAGVVSEVGEGTLTVVLDHPTAWQRGERVDLRFDFENSRHAFSSRVIEEQGASLRLELPESLYKSLRRDFDRVTGVEGFRVSFRLAGVGSVDLSFPLMGSPPRAPAVSEAFDPASVKELFDAFTDRVRSAGGEGRIVMLRNRAALSYEERILQATGKALWIPSTADDLPSRCPLPEPTILTKAEVVQYEREAGIDPTLILSRVEDLVYRKRREGVGSDLHWPLVRGRYFVGYLHVRAASGAIGTDLLEWVGQFAKVLCFALERSGYFREDEPQVRPYQAEAVDLSASGLLFAHPDKGLYRKLLVHSDIQVALRARNRSLTIGARVVRKFSDRDRVYVALRFLEISPEDFRYLYETLYGRAFDPEDVLSETGPPGGQTPA